MLSADNRDLSPYHQDTVTWEAGHLRNGHWAQRREENLDRSTLFIF